MEARSQAQCTTKGNEMNLIPNLTAFSWKTMQTDGCPVLAFASQFSIRFAERNRAFDIAARIQNPNLS
jgi:hypothetical protein